MVRASRGGQMADEFIEKEVVAIAWDDIGDLSRYSGKEEILEAVREAWPDGSSGWRRSSASQLERFRSEPKIGDRVVTYDSSRRIYHIGTIAGEYEYRPEEMPPYTNVRRVDWEGELERDKLSVSARNSLGSTLTLFRVPDDVAEEVEEVFAGKVSYSVDSDDEVNDTDSEEELLKGYKAEALEIIKDRVSRLSPAEMEELVAGLLRAMGYRTKVSQVGADRGVDILASPDGFGFESPRIMVEVKHRPNTAIGSQSLRAFLGGRHEGDKGLYVSTGGFTKDAIYEAERAKIPLKLMDLGDLVDALMEHYDNADAKTRSLLPLTKLYWPI